MVELLLIEMQRNIYVQREIVFFIHGFLIYSGKCLIVAEHDVIYEFKKCEL